MVWFGGKMIQPSVPLSPETVYAALDKNVIDGLGSRMNANVLSRIVPRTTVRGVLVLLVAIAVAMAGSSSFGSRVATRGTTSQIRLTNGWTFSDLGALTPTDFSVATGINNTGLIVGNSGQHAVTFKGGAVQRLDNETNSVAAAVNDRGQIVGSLDPNNGPAVEFVNGHTVNIGQGVATDINSSGTVVGWLNSPTGQHAVQFLPTYRDLNPPGAYGSIAFAVNRAGQILLNVATQNSSGLVTDATFLSTRGQLTPLVKGPSTVFAFGLNDVGAAVGNDVTTLGEEPVIVRNGVVQQIPLLPGDTFDAPGGADFRAINNPGTAVGQESGHAIVYLRGRLVDPNTWLPAGSNWRIVSLSAVNQLNQMVGYATTCMNFVTTPCVYHAVLLNPFPR